MSALFLSEEDQKDQQIMIDAFLRVQKRGNVAPKPFWWHTMFVAQSQSPNEETAPESDEKETKENTESKEERLSQIIDTSHEQMCRYGHECLEEDKEEDYNIKDSKCIQCGSVKDRVYCYDCCSYEGAVK